MNDNSQPRSSRKARNNTWVTDPDTMNKPTRYSDTTEVSTTILKNHSKFSSFTGKGKALSSKNSFAWAPCETSFIHPFGPRIVPSFIPLKLPSEVKPTSSIEDYSLGQVLGRGAFSIVKSAYHKPTKRRVAIKIYEKTELQDPTRKRSVDKEIAILSQLDHPNVIKLYETVHTEDLLYLVFEYVGGAVLSTYVRRGKHRGISEQESRRLFYMILSGIEYCHSQNVCHRDIKLENILVDQAGIPKLIDFGFATCAALDRKVKIFCGTPNYMAPEILNRTEYLGPPVDIWACGILVYSMLTTAFPFKAAYDKEIYHRIQYGIYDIPTYFTPELRDLVISLLHPDPLQRPTASCLLENPWFFSPFCEESTRVDTDSDAYAQKQTECGMKRIMDEEGNYYLVRKN